MPSKTKNGAYDILVAQIDAVTKIVGVIMPEAIDNLEDKIGGIFINLPPILMIVKSTDTLCVSFPRQNTDW